MSVIAPAAMCAVRLPPNGIFSVNVWSGVAVHDADRSHTGASIAAQLQIAVCTELGSTP